MSTESTKKKILKNLSGVVVSDKMQKTAVVLVRRFVKHPKYQKFIVKTKKYKVHDENNTAKIDDKVVFESCRPISKDKSFRLVSINGERIK